MNRTFIISSFVLALVAWGCSPRKVSLSIGEVVADPGRYGEQTVELEGEVSGGVGLLSVGIYTLADSTGEIGILTGKGLPANGSRLKVRGEVLSGITIGGTHYGTSLQEDSRDYLD